MKKGYTIKPQPTHYKDTFFRSTLEATWAAWFDKNEIRWEYEPERRLCENGLIYTPDFVIESAGIKYYVEIKPKFEAFDAWTKKRIFAFIESKLSCLECHKFLLAIGDPTGKDNAYTIFDGKSKMQFTRHKTFFEALGFFSVEFSIDLSADIDFGFVENPDVISEFVFTDGIGKSVFAKGRMRMAIPPDGRFWVIEISEIS